MYMVRKKLMICSLVALGVIFSVDGERGPMARLKPPQSRDSFPVNISAHFSIVAPLWEDGDYRILKIGKCIDVGKYSRLRGPEIQSPMQCAQIF